MLVQRRATAEVSPAGGAAPRHTETRSVAVGL
jgi:hypothetical protein